MRNLYALLLCLALAALPVWAADVSVTVTADWSAGKQYFTDSSGTQLGTTAKPALVLGDRVTVTLNVLSNSLTVGSLATGTYVASLTDGTNTLATLPTGTGTASSAITFPEWRVNSAALNAYIGDTAEHETFPSYRRGRNVTFLLTDTSGNTLVSDATFELHASRSLYDPAVTRTDLDGTDFAYDYSTGAVTIGNVSVAKGGTGATTASAARTALGLGAVAVADTVGGTLAATMAVGDVTPTIPVLLAVAVPLTEGATVLTPSVAIQIVDVWAVSGEAGAENDTVQVSVGSSGALTDAMPWSATAGSSTIAVRCGEFTPTVASVSAGEAITVTTNTGGASVAAGVLYILGYRP